MNKRKTISVVLLVTLFASIFSSNALAVFNKQINYQGKLTTSAFVAVANGTYNMEFKLYTVSSGGAAIWTETRTGANKVQVTNGLFSVMLGEVNSLSGIDFNQTLYLGVNIGGTGAPGWDGEMSPRKKIGAVPASVVSEKTNNLFAGTAGALPYQSAADTTLFTAVGTLGQTLVSGGTGTPTWFAPTLGSVIYTGTGGALAQDNANFFWDATTHRLGIGNASPQALLDLGTAGSTLGAIRLAGSTSGNVTIKANVVAGTNTILTLPATTGTLALTSDITGAFSNYVPYTGGTSNVDLGAHNLTVDTNSLFVDSVNHRVGIGTTSPSTTLDVNGAITTNNSLTLNGSSWGIYQTNSAAKNYFNGSVGIGTASPVVKLNVEGGTGTAPSTSGTTHNGTFRMRTSDNAVLDMGIIAGGLGSWLQSTDQRNLATNYPLLLNPNGGNVGIGITSPGAKLDVIGDFKVGNTRKLYYTGDGTLSIQANDGGGWANRYSFLGSAGTNVGGYGALGANDALTRFFIGTYSSDEKISILANGNVGIGTTGPGVTLDASQTTALARFTSSTGTNRAGYLAANNGGTLYTGMNDSIGTGLISTGGIAYAGVMNVSGAYPLQFGTSDTARMTILSNGNVGIGTTSPGATLDVAGGLRVYTPSYTNSNMSFSGAGSASGYSSLRSKVDQTYGWELDQFGSTYGANDYAQPNGTALVNINNAPLILGTSNVSRLFIKGDGNVGIGTTSPGAKLDVSGNANISGNLSVASLTQGGYLNPTQDNLVYNGDFESGTTAGWGGGGISIASGGNSGNYALQVTGNQQITSTDFIPVDPTKDVVQLEAYVKKATNGSSGGGLYFGYIAYDANKSGIYTAPCGTYCYFAASYQVIPVDGNWHKLSATTTGEGTSYPNFPVGTRYIQVLGLVNYSGSADSVTLIDHVSVKKINNGPVFVGQYFTGTNWTDQNQQTKLYTNSSNQFIIDAPGNVGIGTTNPSAKFVVNTGTGGEAIQVGNVPAGFYQSLSEKSITAFNNNLTLSGTNTILQPTTGNVGIGTTNPGVKLDVVGLNETNGGAADTTIARIWNPYHVSSATMAARLDFILDDDNNFYKRAQIAAVGDSVGYADQTHLTFSTGNVTPGTQAFAERMRITSTGNVGIGTTDPQAPLNIYKAPTSGFVEQLRIGGTGNYRSLDLGTYGSYGGYMSTFGNDMFILAGRGVASENHNIHFFTGFNGSGGAAENNERMTIQYNGNVGIGTTTPYTKLELNGSAQSWAGSPTVTFSDTAGQANSRRWIIGGVAAGNYGDFTFAVSSDATGNPTNPKMTIDRNGLVGIGTTSPSSPLDVRYQFSKTDTTRRGVLNLYSNDATNAMGLVITSIGAAAQANRTVSLQTQEQSISNSGNLVLQDSGGNVGIGTTSPGYKLEVSGGNIIVSNGYISASAGSGDVYSTKLSTAYNFPYIDSYLDSVASTSYEGRLHFRTNSGGGAMADRMVIQNNGNVGIGTTSPTHGKLEVTGGNIVVNRPSNKVDSNGSSELPAFEINNSFVVGQSGYVRAYYPSYNNLLFGADYDGNVGGAQPNIQFGRAGSPYLTVVNNGSYVGNVGIGTTDASAGKLTVAGGNLVVYNGASWDNMALYTDGSNSYIQGNGDETGIHIRSGAGNVLLADDRGSVGIGTTSPSDILNVANGAGGAIRLSYSPDSNNYYYRIFANVSGSGDPNTGFMGFQVHNWPGSTVTPMVLTGSGNVGIGTTGPAARLQVSGGYVMGDKDYGFVNADYHSGRNNIWSVSPAAVNWGMSYYQGGSDYFGFHPNGSPGSPNMIIRGDGNVGIGTTDPKGRLEIVSPNPNVDGAVFGYSLADNNFPIQTYIDNTWASRTSYAGGCCNNLALQPEVGTVSIGGTSGNYGANKLNVLGQAYFSSNVGIGITSPASQLHLGNGITGGDATNRGNLIIESGSTDGATNGLELKAYGGGSGYGFRLATVFDGYAYDDLRIQTRQDSAAWTSPMVVKGTGNVGIGTTNPISKLTVGSNDGDAAAAIYGNAYTGVEGVGTIGVYGQGTSYDFYGEGGEYASGGSWNNGSDRNTKENFQILDDQTILKKIIDLPVTQWNYKKAKGSQHIGPMAQDFYSLFGLGDNDKSISTVDPSGIALVGIKALNANLGEMDLKIGAITGQITPTPGSEPESFANAFFGNVFTKLITWFADTGNGIGDFVANRIHTKELCISDDTGETCVSRTQLNNMLTGSAAGAGNNTGSNPGTGALNLSAPVITLTGESIINLTVGDTYSEQGATAKDDIDTYVAVNIDSSLVDTANAGTYEVTYNAIDTQNNKAVEVRRTVVVKAAVLSQQDTSVIGAPAKDTPAAPAPEAPTAPVVDATPIEL